MTIHAHPGHCADMDIECLDGRVQSPQVSVILLDWSVRESFHTLEYLSRQRCDRNNFEIIWIEFYDHRPEHLESMIERNGALAIPPPIDTWIRLHHDRGQHYHKHVMYNLAVLNARGAIVCILDSDAILQTTFISTIIDQFEGREHLALHFEQIRSANTHLYPFNYPLIEEINGPGCMNARGGVPNGFQTCAKSLKEDPNLWHVYNYGACFCTRKDDFIRYGGADEHEDYMGHICGPYEMTARMVNAGIDDLLHPTHYLYHAYHPSQGGVGNYCGPNNGRGMSTTAMKIPHTGRIMPLKENPQIREARLAMPEGAD